MTLSNFYRVKSIWLIFQPLFHSFVSFSFQNNVYSNSKEITCKQNVNNFWMNVIWLVKCKWNVLSRRSGKIMEIVFKEKKTFFWIGVFFFCSKRTFSLAVSTYRFFLYYFAVFLEQYYIFFFAIKIPFYLNQTLDCDFKKAKKKNKQKKIPSELFL